MFPVPSTCYSSITCRLRFRYFPCSTSDSRISKRKILEQPRCLPEDPSADFHNAQHHGLVGKATSLIPTLHFPLTTWVTLDSFIAPKRGVTYLIVDIREGSTRHMYRPHSDSHILASLLSTPGTSWQ